MSGGLRGVTGGSDPVADVLLNPDTFKVELTKEEFHLVTKALTGALHLEDRGDALALGRTLLDSAAKRAQARADALGNALNKTK